MHRLVALGLTALVLSACQRAAEPAEPVAPASTAPAVLSVADVAWQAEVDRYLAVNVQPSEPVDAVIWRGVRCEFLGRNVSGANPARDQAINARRNELRCGDELSGEARG